MPRKWAFRSIFYEVEMGKEDEKKGSSNFANVVEEDLDCVGDMLSISSGF